MGAACFPPPLKNWVKGAVSVISPDPKCKDDNARFTKVALKPISDKKNWKKL